MVATCYPRPVQEKIPILVGGSGEARTLPLVARYADACNLFGEPDRVHHLVEVLHGHCAAIGRDPTEIRVTQLSSVLVASTTDSLTQRVEELRGDATNEQFIEATTAGVVAHHLDRFERLADAGVDEVMVSLADVGHPGALAAFGEVIDKFR